MTDIYASVGANPLIPREIKYGEISAASTTGTVEAISIPIYGVVEAVTYYLKENFDGGATSELTIQIGDGSDADGYITAQSVHADSTPVVSALVDGAYLNDLTTDNVVNGKQYAAADTIDVLFTATGANLDALTQGSVVIVVKYIDPKTAAGL